MFLQLVLLATLIKFGKPETCVGPGEIRLFKADLQVTLSELDGDSSMTSSDHGATSEEIQELTRITATRENIDQLIHNISAGNQVILDALASKPSLTRDEVLQLLSNKATFEDVQQRAKEVVQSLNSTFVAGNEHILAVLLEILESQNGIRTLLLSLNNSWSLSPAATDCATRDEVRAIVQEEMDSVLQTIQSEVQLIRTEVDSIVQSVRNEVQSIQTNLHSQLSENFGEIRSTLAELLRLLNVQPTSKTTSDDTPTTREPLSRSTDRPPTPQPETAASTAAPSSTSVVSPTTQMPDPVISGPIHTCNGTSGWRRLKYIDMTNTSYNCPTGLKLTSYSKRTCGRAHVNWRDCSSTTFRVLGIEYSQVCGRIRGYQVGSTQAFRGYFENSQSINGWYAEGVSLTHGPAGGRQHIWTFAAGLSQARRSNQHWNCPCDSSIEGASGPHFVGNDYFCESGLHSSYVSAQHSGVLFPDNPLWDGQGCTSTSTCCQLNNPPWFTKNLPNPTTDDIELRLCLTGSSTEDDVAIEVIDLYIK